MIIRSSKHLMPANGGKKDLIKQMFDEYKICLELYITDIITGNLPLVKKLSSAKLPTYNVIHSKYKRDIYIKASEIIRSQIKKAEKQRYKKYKYIYKYFVTNKPDSKFSKTKFSNLNLKDIVKTKFFTKPTLNNISINLTNEFYDYHDEETSFDQFIAVKTLFMNGKGSRAIKTNLPLNYHRHSNKLLNNGFKLRNNIQLKLVGDKLFINLVWYKEITPKENGASLGIDIGYKKLLALSDGTTLGEELFGLYDKISKKKQGSKNFKQLLIHRDNLINYYVNQVDLDGLKTIVIEDLVNVKHKSKTRINNKLQRWSYRKAIDKINRTCEVNGLTLVKVSPAYTSQTCSKCDNVDKESRNGELYHCKSCGYQIDSDINAAINIHNRGIYSPSNN